MSAKPRLTEGTKFDQGKPTFHLLPDDAIAEIELVLEFGARKYEPRNWERGMDWLRVWNACMRHLWAWARGQDTDPETNLPHLAHAGCCILFLLAYAKRRIGKDDRPIAASSVDPSI